MPKPPNARASMDALCLIVEVPRRGPYPSLKPPLVLVQRDLVIRRPRVDLVIGRCVPQSSHPSDGMAVIFKRLVVHPLTHLSLARALLSFCLACGGPTASSSEHFVANVGKQIVGSVTWYRGNSFSQCVIQSLQHGHLHS
jgi:hypothetical protein